MVQWEEKWWQKLRLSVWIHRLHSLVFVASLPTGILCVRILDPSPLPWGNTAVEQQPWLCRDSAAGGGVGLRCMSTRLCHFCASGVGALSYHLTSVFPLVSFSPPKMAKASCPSGRYMKINSKHEVISLWRWEWSLFALKYDNLFTWYSNLKISLTIVENYLFEQPKKLVKTHGNGEVTGAQVEHIKPLQRGLIWQ